jgi:hypothetical protein
MPYHIIIINIIGTYRDTVYFYYSKFNAVRKKKLKPGTCKKYTVLSCCILLFTAAVQANLPPLSDIEIQKVSGYLSSPPYGWNYAFDIGFSNLEVNVKMRIRLTGYDPSPALESVWENGIESMWSNRYDIVDDTFRYHVNFDTIFYDIYDPSIHHTVNVIYGVGRGNMLNWYTTTEWGSQYNGPYVAHEVGHMFSLYDEYSGGAVNPSNPLIDYTSIMGSLAGDIKERHYDPFLNWLQGKAPDRELVLGEYDPTWKIPEPATILLFCFAGVLLRRRKHR